MFYNPVFTSVSEADDCALACLEKRNFLNKFKYGT